MSTLGTGSRGGAVLMAALVVDSIGNGLFLPLQLVFFSQLTDVRLGLLGVLMSAANTLTLPIPVWTGVLVDRFGAFPLVVAAQLMQGAGYLGYDRVHGPVGILLATTLVAVGVRVFWSSVFTAVADFADGSPSTRTKDTWFAWANTTRTAGLSAGGLVAAAAIADGSDGAYRAVAHGSAAAYLTAAVAIAVFVRAPGRVRGTGDPQAGYRTLLRDRVFLAFTGVNTVFATTSMMLALGLPVFVLDGLHGPRFLAPAILVGNTVLLAALAAPVIKRLAPYRRSRVVIAAAVLWAVWCLLFAALSPTLRIWLVPLLAGAALLFTAAELLHAPVSMALATGLAPAAARGRYLAVFQYSFTFAGMVAPAFFTTLFEAGRALPWLVLGAVNLLAALAMRLLEPRIPAAAQHEERPSGDDRRLPKAVGP
ncbi:MULTISPECIES: MFS transporter [Streptacidiphilus]|uniref:MFS transporter n=2 Tax=Streptacidiphilus TaxID=228398 RepID=A0ABV6UKU0_9ACTN|nr:MFS transporter [Streptacidiphilus jeojiense]